MSSHVTPLVSNHARNAWKTLFLWWKDDASDPKLVDLAKEFLAHVSGPPFQPAPETFTLKVVNQALEAFPQHIPQGATFDTIQAVLAVFLSVPPKEGETVPVDQQKALAEKATDAVAVCNAFDKTPFLNIQAVLLLLKHLWIYASEWVGVESLFYAPYAALINASMTGKSRLVTELRKRGVFLMLICLRQDKDPNYRPPRTARIADWATQKQIDSVAQYTGEVCAFFHAFVVELIAFLRQQRGKCKLPALTEAWFTAVYADSNEGFWARILEVSSTNARSEGVAKFVKAAEKDPAETESIIEYWRGEIAREYAVVDELLQNLLGQSAWSAAKRSQVNFLFVVDEARQLNVASESRDRFVMFRRAMRCLPWNDKRSQGNSFCIVTDTTSKVANLAPVQKYDPSFRIAKHQGKKLFPPFTLMDTLDVYWNEATKVEVPVGGDLSAVLQILREQLVPMVPRVRTHAAAGAPVVAVSLAPLGQAGLQRKLLESFEVMAMMGRPAFYGFLVHRAAVGKVAGFAALVTLLQAKLLCQSPTAEERSEEFELDEELQADFAQAAASFAPRLPVAFSSSQVIAVLGTLASVNISAASHMASELASGHMRLVAAISKQRKYVYTLEVPEPLLGFAAHCLIMSGRVPWHVVIDKYSALVLNNTTDVGFRGEVAGQILCLVAWQKCLRRRAEERRLPEFEFPFIPAIQFIKALVGSALYDQLSTEIRTGLESVLSQAFVRVNQFAKTYVELGVDTLREFFVRASGVYCKQGQAAVDLAIPLWFGQESFAEEAFSVLLLQLKLRMKSLSPADLQEWHRKLESLPLIREIHPGRPVVAVCLELGPPRGAESAVPNMTTRSGSDKASHVADGVSTPVVVSDAAGSASSTHVLYALRFRNVSLANVVPEDREAEEAFKRLLESTIDPSTTLNVEKLHRDAMTNIFKLPFMDSRQKTNKKRKTIRK